MSRDGSYGLAKIPYEKVCEYCGQPFTPKSWQYRNQRFCSKPCMYTWRKSNSKENRICKCGIAFETYKMSPKKYCSNFCPQKHKDQGKFVSDWLIENNPMKNLESRKKISEKLKGRNVGFGAEGKRCRHTKESKRIMGCKRIEKMKTNGYKVSKLETDVCVHLIEAGIKIETQFRVENFLYDIYIPNKNTLIEVNGDYWHCNPSVYKEPRDKIQVIKVERDERKTKCAIDHGYRLLVIWESDIKSKGIQHILESSDIY